MYGRRIIDSELDELLPSLPAIAIDGPKAVGKTTTAMQRATSVLNLDLEHIESLVKAAPHSILNRARPLLIDEWQRVPEVWDVVRRAVDQDYSGGQFLLTGSATPPEGATAHSGAGRIARLRMRPLAVCERGLTESTVSFATLLSGTRPDLSGECSLTLSDYAREIALSGFPGIRSLSGRAHRIQLDSYLREVVDRDVLDSAPAVRKPEALLNWLRAYAAASSTATSYSQILDAATPGDSDKPARSTVDGYRALLSAMWLLDPVPAWQPTGNWLSRLGKSPKHQLADPALAVRLLDLSSDDLLDGRGDLIGSQHQTMLGALFESLVTLSVRVIAQAAEASVYHLRTRNGDHEIDLIVRGPGGKLLAIEVKLSAAISDSDVKHLNWLQSQVGERLADAIVINTGPAAYRRKDGVGVVPLALLGP